MINESMNKRTCIYFHRDLLISRLMHEVNELKYELSRVKAEDGMLIESLNNRIKELEMELNELRQIAESTQLVCILYINCAYFMHVYTISQINNSYFD